MKTKEQFIELRNSISEAIKNVKNDKYVIRKGGQTLSKTENGFKLVPELYFPQSFDLVEAHEVNKFYNLRAEIILLSDFHRVNLTAIDAIIENYELFI